MKRILRHLIILVCLQTMMISSLLAQESPWRLLHMSAEAAHAVGLTTVTLHTGHVSGEMPLMLRVVVDENRDVPIRPTGQGRVESIHVLPGQAVKKGDILLSYRNHSLHTASLQAMQLKAALVAANADRDEAAAAYARGRTLAGETVSTGELRRRRDALAVAQATVQAREADIATLDHRFREEFHSASESISGPETTDIVAPVTGIVKSLPVAITASIGPETEIARVTDLSTVWLVADVTPEDAARLSPDSDIQVSLPTGPFLARIAGIDTPATSGAVRLIVEMPNSSGALAPAMAFDAVATTRENSTGLIVPSEAVRQINGDKVVFVRAGAEAYRPIPVAVVIENEENAIIQSASLSGNETIVAHGSLALKSLIELAAMGDAD